MGQKDNTQPHSRKAGPAKAFNDAVAPPQPATAVKPTVVVEPAPLVAPKKSHYDIAMEERNAREAAEWQEVEDRKEKLQADLRAAIQDPHKRDIILENIDLPLARRAIYDDPAFLKELGIDNVVTISGRATQPNGLNMSPDKIIPPETIQTANGEHGKGVKYQTVLIDDTAPAKLINKHVLTPLETDPNFNPPDFEKIASYDERIEVFNDEMKRYMTAADPKTGKSKIDAAKADFDRENQKSAGAITGAKPFWGGGRTLFLPTPGTAYQQVEKPLKERLGADKTSVLQAPTAPPSPQIDMDVLDKMIGQEFPANGPSPILKNIEPFPEVVDKPEAPQTAPVAAPVKRPPVTKPQYAP